MGNYVDFWVKGEKILDERIAVIGFCRIYAGWDALSGQRMAFYQSLSKWSVEL
jgi:hypothetical protein